jgi:Origin recognition complex (ORC) subunit 4 C-terminus
MIIGLPRNSLIVLIAAKKVAERSSLFNYDAVYSKYRTYQKTHATLGSFAIVISKQVFLKLFVDLINQGFLRTSSEGHGHEGDGAAEVLNVNNKVCLGFRKEELVEMLHEARDRLGLSH